MSVQFKVSRSGYDAETDTDPNHFIIHSDYNCLKILSNGKADITVPTGGSIQTFTVAHGLSYRPMVIAFMRETTLNEVVFMNNENDNGSSLITFYTTKVDSTNIIFRLRSDDMASRVVHIRYLLLDLGL